MILVLFLLEKNMTDLIRETVMGICGVHNSMNDGTMSLQHFTRFLYGNNEGKVQFYVVLQI